MADSRGCLGKCQVVTNLLEVGAEVHVVDRIGRSVLHLAAEHGHADAVSILVNSMTSRQLDIHAEVRMPVCVG